MCVGEFFNATFTTQRESGKCDHHVDVILKGQKVIFNLILWTSPVIHWGWKKKQTLLTLSVSKDLSLWSNAAILLQGHKTKAFVTHRKSAQCVQFKVQMCCVFPLLVRSWRTAPVLRQPWMPKFGDLNISDSMKEQILLYRLRLSAIFFKWINHLLIGLSEKCNAFTGRNASSN